MLYTLRFIMVALNLVNGTVSYVFGKHKMFRKSTLSTSWSQCPRPEQHYQDREPGIGRACRCAWVHAHNIDEEGSTCCSSGMKGDRGQVLHAVGEGVVHHVGRHAVVLIWTLVGLCWENLVSDKENEVYEHEFYLSVWSGVRAPSIQIS